MLVLITYDVNTESAAGRTRLRKVAKTCQNYGQRVQNSVFECVVDNSQIIGIKHKLLNLIEPKVDSLRFYFLGNDYKEKIEHYGAKPSFDVTEPLII